MTRLELRQPARPWSNASRIVQASIRGRNSLGPKNRSSLKLRFWALRISSKYTSTGLRGVWRHVLLSLAERGVLLITPEEEFVSDVRICNVGFFIVWWIPTRSAGGFIEGSECTSPLNVDGIRGTNDYLNELNALGCRGFNGCHQQGETPCSAIRRRV